MLKEGNRAHIETKLELIIRRKEKRSSEHGGQRRCRAQSVSKQPRQTLGTSLSGAQAGDHVVQEAFPPPASSRSMGKKGKVNPGRQQDG